MSCLEIDGANEAPPGNSAVSKGPFSSSVLRKVGNRKRFSVIPTAADRRELSWRATSKAESGRCGFSRCTRSRPGRRVTASLSAYVCGCERSVLARGKTGRCVWRSRSILPVRNDRQSAEQGSGTIHALHHSILTYPTLSLTPYNPEGGMRDSVARHQSSHQFSIR